MRLVYSAVLYLLLPLIVLRMLWRSRRAPEYRQRLLERCGIFSVEPRPGVAAIWVHAVSVGEVLAAAPLIEELLCQYPGDRLVVTTTTPTGSERVRALFGERVCHVYAPWDLPCAVRGFLRRTRPRLLLLMETELWPNMLHCTRAGGARIVLANARLSERSARGYARFDRLTRQMLAQLDGVACQSPADARRFLALGLSPAVLVVTGNIKFDLDPGAQMRAGVVRLRQDFGSTRRPVLVAGSTHTPEEQLILEAFARLRRKWDDCLLVLVPRHPERFDAVHTLCSAAGWQVSRRSAGTAPTAADAVVLGDTMGELPLLYGAATVAFVGGSLSPRGGHNVLEPAAWGVPVVSGPHLYNFSQVSSLLQSAGALRVVAGAQQLQQCLENLLADDRLRQAMAAAGQQVVADNRGGRKRLLELLKRQLADA